MRSRWGCRLCALRRVPACSLAASYSAIARPALLSPTRAVPATLHSDENLAKASITITPSLPESFTGSSANIGSGCTERPRSAPRAKIGSEPDSGFIASESSVATTVRRRRRGDRPSDPDLAPDGGREEGPDGTQVGTDADGGTTDGTDIDPSGGADTLNNAEVAGGGSDYTDNAIVTDTTVTPPSLRPTPRRDAADRHRRSVPLLPARAPSRRRRLVERGPDHLAAAANDQSVQSARRAPEPEPETGSCKGPAFRGGPPELPRRNRSSTRQAVSQAAAATIGPPVSAVRRCFQAPIVAVPVPPPAAARFPSFPPAATPRRVSARPLHAARRRTRTTAAQGGQTAGPQQQAPAGTVTSMSGQTPRQGYTDYLRSPGLPAAGGCRAARRRGHPADDASAAASSAIGRPARAG